MKKIYIIRCFLFIAIIIVPMLTMNLKKEQVSEIDNRNLMEAKDVFNGDMKTNVEQFLSDRIGFRSGMIKLYTKGMDLVFHEMIHPSYQYGQEGYIFSKIHRESYNLEFQEVYSSFIAEFQDYCDSKKIDFLYVVEPAKESVYTEYLPKGYKFTNNNTDYFVRLLKEKGINYLDSTDILNEKKDEVQVYDKKYDARHWNETGALIVITNILERLNEMNPAIDKLDPDKYEEVFAKNTTLPVSYFSIDEDTIHYNLIEDHSVIINDKDSVELSSQYHNFNHFINTENVSAPKILVFGGSYFNGKNKFFTENFSEYIRVHNYHNVINYEYYIELFNPDVVLFESTEYTHTNNYFPVEQMKEVIARGAD
jgi:hypothetical protein